MRIRGCARRARLPRGVLKPTPLIHRDGVTAALGLDVWLGSEDLLPTAAFKVRSRLDLVGAIRPRRRRHRRIDRAIKAGWLAYAGGRVRSPGDDRRAEEHGTR